QRVDVTLSLSPAWSTEWITPEARAKLKAFGLAPPPRHQGDLELALLAAVTCPYCGSQDVVLQNSFGPTLCRMIYTCNGCRQPFEQFKPV
ncbi:MAG TPA: 1,2-phenylacetyl-CoA epoxidase subunit PaaD, partial [Anaerolineales bacterium]